MVTNVPIAPLVGLNELIVGDCAKSVLLKLNNKKHNMNLEKCVW
jgi:hypothetical protein